MATVELTKENFVDTINNNDFVVVDYWAPWCGPCKNFGPVYEEVSEQYPDIIFAKVNTEAEEEIGGQMQIRSIPTLMIFREQVMLYNEAGALAKNVFEGIIKQASEIDMKDVHAQIAEEEKKAQGDNSA